MSPNVTLSDPPPLFFSNIYTFFWHRIIIVIKLQSSLSTDLLFCLRVLVEITYNSINLKEFEKECKEMALGKSKKSGFFFTKLHVNSPVMRRSRDSQSLVPQKKITRSVAWRMVFGYTIGHVAFNVLQGRILSWEIFGNPRKLSERFQLFPIDVSYIILSQQIGIQ